MAETTPSLLIVEETDFEEVQATDVTVFLCIRGSALIAGDAALSKAREVNALVAELKRFGIPEGDIHLIRVRANVTTGMLGRNSSASYELSVFCPQTSMLPDVLGIITSQKNTEVQYLTWGFGDLREVEMRILDRCIALANARAQRMANGMGAQIQGIHRCTHISTEQQRIKPPSYDDWDRAGSPGRYDGGRYDIGSRSRVSSDELGLEVTHTRKVGVGVTIEYRLADKLSE